MAKMGRPPKAREQKEEIVRLWKYGESPTAIAKKLGISRASVYRNAPITDKERYLRALRAEVNRYIVYKKKEMGAKDFYKGFPEMLEDNLIDFTSDENDCDSTMSLLCADQNLWIEFKVRKQCEIFGKAAAQYEKEMGITSSGADDDGTSNDENKFAKFNKEFQRVKKLLDNSNPKKKDKLKNIKV